MDQRQLEAWPGGHGGGWAVSPETPYQESCSRPQSFSGCCLLFSGFMLRLAVLERPASSPSGLDGVTSVVASGLSPEKLRILVFIDWDLLLGHIPFFDPLLPLGLCVEAMSLPVPVALGVLVVSMTEFGGQPWGLSRKVASRPAAQQWILPGPSC